MDDPIRIPQEPLAEAIEEFLAAFDNGRRTRHAWAGHSSDIAPYLPISALIDDVSRMTGERRGTVARRIWRMRKGNYSKTVGLAVADAVLCAVGKPERFYSDSRLAEVYERIQ